ncbi:Hypothetical predicted protein [Pelobates cultripes]|uniref:Uncharacterized protein n=1 Tax=Pelobates cultripes TaxID=61616 RepID=A0AAD1STI0_PELCU|nr:Hypothetical predicted protein [Pelobates cultripes]
MDTENVEPSPPAVNTDTEKTIQPAPEKDVVNDTPPLPAPSTPAVNTITEETIQPPLEKAITIDSAPLPGVVTLMEKTNQPAPEEDVVNDTLPLPLARACNHKRQMLILHHPTSSYQTLTKWNHHHQLVLLILKQPSNHQTKAVIEVATIIEH